MLSLVRDSTCPPWVRLELCAQVVSQNTEVDLSSDIERIIFGTALTADYHNLPGNLISTLAPMLSSHILKNSEHISPKLRMHMVEVLLSEEREEHCSISDELRFGLARDAVSVMLDPLVDDSLVPGAAMSAKSVISPQEFICVAQRILDELQYSIERKKVSALSIRPLESQSASESRSITNDIVAETPTSENQSLTSDFVVKQPTEAELSRLTIAIERFGHDPSKSALDEMLRAERTTIVHGGEPNSRVDIALAELGEASILAERVLNTRFPDSSRKNALWGLEHVLAVDQLKRVVDDLDPTSEYWVHAFDMLAPLTGPEELFEICSDGIARKNWPEKRTTERFQAIVASAPAQDRDRLASLALEKSDAPSVLRVILFAEVATVREAIDSELATLLRANPSLMGIMLQSTRMQGLTAGAVLAPVWRQSAKAILESLSLEQRLLLLANVLKASSMEQYEQIIKTFVPVKLAGNECDEATKVALNRGEQVLSLVADSEVSSQIQQLLSPILLPVTKSALKQYASEEDIVRVSVKLFLHLDEVEELEHFAVDTLTLEPGRLGYSSKPYHKCLKRQKRASGLSKSSWRK